MKKKKTAPKSLLHSLIRSIFSIHLCVLAISLLLSSALLFSTSKKQYEKQSHASLDLLVLQLDSLAETLLSIRNECLLDATFSEYLSTPRTYSASDIRLQRSAIKTLFSYTLSHHYIDSFTVFQGNTMTLNVSSDNRIHGLQTSSALAIQQTSAFQNTNKSALAWGGIHQYNQLLPSYYNDSSNKTSVIALLLSLGKVSDDSEYSVLSANIPETYFQMLFSQHTPAGCYVNLYDSERNLLLSSSKEAVAKKSDLILSGSMQYTDWTLEIIIPFSVFWNNVKALLLATCSVSLIASLLVTVISSLTGRRLLNPFQNIILQIDEIHSGNLERRISSQEYVELDNLTMHFNDLMDRIQQLVQTNQNYAEEKRILEVQTLQSQINPHFLYNSLTTIRWMASMARAENVCQALLSLSNILRPVFSDSSIFWSLKAENTFLENYIAIMSYRIGYKTRLVLEIPDDYQEMIVPRFILQPLVENSLMHGLASVFDENAREIRITAEKSDSYLNIYVCDNGKGIAPEKMEQLNIDLEAGIPTKGPENKNSIGLYNVNRRLLLQYGEGAGLLVLPSESGAVIRVRLRLKDKDSISPK